MAPTLDMNLSESPMVLEHCNLTFTAPVPPPSEPNLGTSVTPSEPHRDEGVAQTS